MDLLAATTLFNRLRQSNERFETETETEYETETVHNYALPVEEKPQSNKTFVIVIWVLWIIFFVGFGAWAAWLSWDANTLVEWDTIPKSIFSCFAFLAGLTYLISYFIHKWDLVMGIRACKKPLVPKAPAF